MRETIALEDEIRGALPDVDAAATMFDAAAPIHEIIRSAHDIICNAWRGPGERRERLREIAIEMRKFKETVSCLLP